MMDAKDDSDGRDQGVVENAEGEVFTDYVCRSAAACGERHPAPISEAASLGAIQLPQTEYPLWDSLSSNGPVLKKLSALQLEGVLYACSKHQELLPNGHSISLSCQNQGHGESAGCGFFVGDGAGVGKGRQISAIIFDNYARGRRRHVWVSTSPDLYREAQRDLEDIGCHIKVIHGCQTLDRETRVLGLSKEYQEGVLFLSYTALISSSRGMRRLDQILKWLGEDFDGCLCFDECHKAKNYIPGVASKSTKVAAHVIELQNACPMARVVYCSATGVSGVGDMAYIERLGLWGPSTAFKDFKDFYECMKRRGVSFLEMLAMELKAEGKYIARSLSFKGTEFDAVRIELTAAQVTMYDAAAQFWQSIQAQLEKAVKLTDVPATAIWRNYWSAHQRFFRSLCISLKVPFVVAVVKEKLKEGYCVVIGLQSTGEAALNASDLPMGQSTHLISSTRVMLRNFMKNHFPTTSAPSAESPEECSVTECLRMKDQILEEIEDLQLPPDFLDKLILDLGGSKMVAEMTGRQLRLEKEAAAVYGVKQRSSRSQGIDSVNGVPSQ